MADFFDAVRGGWKPTAECLGAQSREVLQCMTWKGKQCAGLFVDHIAEKQDCYYIIVMRKSTRKTPLRGTVLGLVEGEE